MSADAQSASRAIVRQLLFYVQLAERPESLAAHVAELLIHEHGHAPDDILVAVDWALEQLDLRALVRQPHGDAVLRRSLSAVVAHLGRW